MPHGGIRIWRAIGGSGVAILAALTLWGTPAAAIEISLGDPGKLAPSIGSATVLDFNSLSVGSLPSYQFDGGGLSGNGAISDMSSPNIMAQPAGDTSKYLTVSGAQPIGSVQLTFSQPANYFGLYWGSLDTYNSISFGKGQQTIATYSGADIANLTGLAANGNQQSSSSNRYVNFDLDSTFFTSVTLSTTNFGFEVDNVAFANTAPEPTSVLLLGTALLGFGIIKRRRRRII